MNANLTLEATRGSVAIKDFLIYRSLDNATFVHIATQDVETVVGTLYSATYTDVGVVFLTNVRYYAVSRDALMNLSADGNIITLSLPVLMVCGQTVGGGSTNQAIITSIDSGATWVAQITPASQTVKAMAQSMTRDGEILGLDTVGAIIRSTNGGSTWALLTNNIGSFGWNDLIRHEGFGLYVASGAGGVIKTSPDGVTWTLRTTPNANGYTKMLIASDGSILAGSNSNITQPVIRSTDGGVTWALVAAFGFATDVQELTQSSNGRFMFGSRNNVSTVTTTDLLNFTQVDGTGATHNSLGYNAGLDLFAVSGSNGIYTSPGTGAPAWTVRNATLPFQSAEDLISMQFAPGFIGIRPLAGAQTTHVIVRSLDGLSWTSITPAQFNVAAVYRRIYEFFDPVP